MPQNTDSFVYGQQKMSRIVDNVRLPFTRFTVDLNRHSPHAMPRYKSMFEITAEVSKDMANRALETMVAGGPARTHLGQTVAGLIASGLSASVLRVPEVHSGSLVAVSI